ncbi:MAG: RidA family protein [bacterium]|nr:RidA family protein [bacterium]
MIERLTTAGVPVPRGPYSPAVRAGDFIYVSGQGPINPATDQMELGDIKDETRLVLTNVQRILEGVGSSIKHVVKCNVYVGKSEYFAGMNEVYAEFFSDAKPTRTTVVTGFVGEADMKVEIDAVAYTPKG